VTRSLPPARGDPGSRARTLARSGGRAPRAAAFRPGPALLWFTVLLVSGCVYYNGMYNANRSQSQAEASERAGRIAEARERWQQAAQHAESLTARHPKSRWVEDALLVQGRALVHLEEWSDAVPVLEEAARRARNPTERTEALGLLGRADLAINRVPEALAALDSAVESGRPATRATAWLDRGRAWIAIGRPESAAVDFARSTHPHARYDLARAELVLRDTAAAAALYDSLAAVGPYVESDWRPALDSLAAARAGASGASELVDRLVTRDDLTSGQRARLLLDDARRRLAASDTAGAASRLSEAVAAGRDSAEAAVAGVRLARLALAGATSDSDLAVEQSRLQALALQGGEAGRAAQSLLRQLAQADRLAAASTTPDAFWFSRAELLRDSLHAGRLAAADCAEMAVKFPDSPWTPKGLVAAIAAGHPAADSLRALLLARYGRSPYTVAATGGTGEDSAYAALEDSLREVLARGVASGSPVTGADAGYGAGENPAIRRGRPGERPVQPQRPHAPSPRPDPGPPHPAVPGP
jgi:predicted negative regulator of RcsB-dependent stress response